MIINTYLTNHHSRTWTNCTTADANEKCTKSKAAHLRVPETFFGTPGHFFSEKGQMGTTQQAQQDVEIN
jgi:hypothetical protein